MNRLAARSIAALVVAAGAAGSVYAQCAGAPAIVADLGTLVPGTPVTGASSVTGNEIRWWKITVPSGVQMSNLTFLNLDNSASAALDLEIGLYRCNGTLVQSDDDDGPLARSALSFGSGDGLFPGALADTPVINNGRDGALPAGDYYVAVSRFPTTHNPTNFSVTSTATTGGAVAVNVLLGAAAPAADPAGTIDLGTMGTTDVRNRSLDPLDQAQVQWYKVIIPETNTALFNFFDIDTETSSLTVNNTTRIAVYTATGAIAGNSISSALTDATDGSNSLSQMTFGRGTRLAVGNGLTYSGRDGALQAGTYFLGIAGPGTTPSSTALSGQNFGFVSTSTNVGTISLNLATGEVTVPPSGTGSSTGCVNVAVGGTANLRVTVAPGGNPASTGIGVSVDASLLGAGSVTLLDDGVNDDGIASNNIFGRSISVASGFTAQTYQLPFTVTDAQSRTGTGNVGVVVTSTNIVPNPTELLPGATIPAGSGTLSSISGSISASQVDLYKINICSPSTFSASTLGGTTVDTQLFIFDANGLGVVVNDDAVSQTTGLQSEITSTIVGTRPAGDYYLAVSQYNRDPVANPCGTLIWVNTPFRSERAPDGPAATGSLFAWTGTTTPPAAPAYTVTLTGACYVTQGAVCDSIDFNNDTLTPDSGDLDDFIAVLSGGPSACSTFPTPGCNDIDFNNDTFSPDALDLDAFISRLGGGPCIQ
jgi:hypothetical protein